MMIKMNKKTIFKILSIALMVAMVAMCLGNVALADVDYKPDGSTSTTATKFQTILNIFLGLAQVIGIAIAVIMLIVLAIK